MITVKRHYKNNKVLWDRFVKSANNGTIFHLRRFLSYHPEGRFVDHSIEFYKKNTLVSVLPAAEFNIDGKNSHHMIEILFKCLGKSFQEALKINKQQATSTKGIL